MINYLGDQMWTWLTSCSTQKLEKNNSPAKHSTEFSTQTPKCTSVVERNNKFPNLFLPSTLVRHFLNVNVIFLGEEASNQPVGQTPTAKRQEKKGGAAAIFGTLPWQPEAGGSVGNQPSSGKVAPTSQLRAFHLLFTRFSIWKKSNNKHVC